ncbi:hypothetical protein [Umezawaea sp. NPDC059074]|uniref:hypothetical protein n=1 Tax=Umezawaea sp. NPDC059074 TaxID=3346716 RepID=UPI003682A180
MATYSYEGRISFEQGVDDEGRAYLDCHDNGIGMGDAELRGVFSKAGDRFPEQADFRLEQEAWETLDPPVKLFPNSRFGIGVLSYFMLADEILVTTCRLGLDGSPGPVLDAVIHGPGHLFRVRRVADCGEPGARVRPYLKRSDEWSSVEVVRRLLGITQFDTTADDHAGRARWAAGEWSPLDRCETVPWRQAPEGVRVIWCEGDGALLVVRPSVSGGGQSTLDSLIRESNRIGVSIAEVVTSLQARGLNIPDLATTIRAALSKVPFAQPPPQPR